ncbi:MAG TPA: efflux RND transporter periplasmic adaptor subunit [Methylomirabilota bacterium]|nr:efflux RND transporter periplasmic adaptor subunit [Methylomirabilota bacterium]
MNTTPNAVPRTPGGFGQPSVRIALIALVIVLILVTAGLMLFKGGEGGQTDQPVFIVEKGPLTISVSESGTIQPRERLVIKNELEGRSTILFIVPEGSEVKKGDLLFELDATALQDQLVNQQIQVQNADAAYVGARENFEIVKNQSQSDVDQAELTFDFAKQDLAKYIQGEYPTQVKEAEARITLAEETVSRAEENHKWSKILFEEKYLSQSELQQDQLTFNKARIDLELAVASLQLLTNFTHLRQVAELESGVKEAEMALERIERKAAANIVQANADLIAREAELGRQRVRLAKMESQIEKAKQYAPMDGQVIYATSVRGGWRGNDEPLREGQEVFERREVIHLPTTSSYMAEVKVHESNLEKIRVGLPVQITVDALPGKMIYGKIGRIAPLPDAQSVFMNPDLKVYNTEVWIDGEGADLRNGMSCRVEMIVDHYPEALYVPVQAVTRVNGKPTVYVAEGGAWKPRAVGLGLDNNRMAHITEGLTPGESVLLTPPMAESEITSSDRSMDTNMVTRLEEANRVVPPVAGPDTQLPSPGGEARDGRRAPGGGPRGEGRGRNVTPEQTEEIRKRFENMSPEDRESMRQQFQQRRQQDRTSSEEGSN